MPSLNILLVEDNPADAYLTMMAVQEADICKEFHVVEHGEQALAFLRQQGAYTGVARPDIIILDLNLPRMDGLTALTAIKADPAIRAIPVVILSTSCAEQDMTQAYHLGAVRYFVKSNDLQECLMFGHTLAGVWQCLTDARVS
ncbi:MAG: response regulator [Deltaproteobacteria bacterium]|nr:response regulator [Deltaproteobacteria bacterium]